MKAVGTCLLFLILGLFFLMGLIGDSPALVIVSIVVLFAWLALLLSEARDRQQQRQDERYKRIVKEAIEEAQRKEAP